MRYRTWFLFAAVVLGAATPAIVHVARAADAPVVRSEIPIRAVTLSDGTRRYGLPIRVGGTMIEAGLDSGSTGLRVLPGMLAEADAKATTRKDKYGYGAGTELRGVTGEGALTVGEVSGRSTLQLVNEVGCLDQIPNCPAKKVALKDFGIQGDGLKGEGFKAIIGVNMAEAEINSPLSAIGAKRWIIELPLAAGKPGRLILNPTSDEMAGYILFKIDPQFRQQGGGMHDAISACLVNTQSKTNLCGPALLDTGAPGLVVLNPPAGPPWPNGAPAALAFVSGGKVQTAAALTIGQRAFASNLQFTPKDNGGVRLHFGITPYFAYSVLYDPAAGVVGLKKRADSPMTVQGF